MSFQEKGFQKFFIRDNLGIIFNLDDFGVAGGAGANFFVSRIFFGAACKTAGDGLYTRQHLKNRLGAPETTAAKSGGFRFVGRVIHNFLLGDGGSQTGAEEDREEEGDSIHFYLGAIRCD